MILDSFICRPILEPNCQTHVWLDQVRPRRTISPVLLVQRANDYTIIMHANRHSLPPPLFFFSWSCMGGNNRQTNIEPARIVDYKSERTISCSLQTLFSPHVPNPDTHMQAPPPLLSCFPPGVLVALVWWGQVGRGGRELVYMCHRLTVFLHVPPGAHAPSTRTMTPATLVDRSGHLLPIVRRRGRSKNRSNRVCSRPPQAPGRRPHDNTQTNKPVSIDDRVWTLSTHYIVLIRPQQTPPLARMYCQLSNFKYSLIL